MFVGNHLEGSSFACFGAVGVYFCFLVLMDLVHAVAVRHPAHLAAGCDLCARAAYEAICPLAFDRVQRFFGFVSFVEGSGEAVLLS